jgi:hypothetical protein
MLLRSEILQTADSSKGFALFHPSGWLACALDLEARPDKNDRSHVGYFRLVSGTAMVFEHIEKLKQEYTDKFVVVDESRPELRRFKGMTGTVRTVNMSGRALVEFDAYNNIGWYDIDVDFLKVIDERLPKPEEKAAPKKAAAKASPKAAPAEKKTPAKAAPKSGNVADILAAARAEKGGAAAAPAAPKDAKSMSVADMLAAARAEKSDGGAAAAAKPATAAPAAVKKDPQSMSVADMLAAARAEKSGGGAATAPAPAQDDPKDNVRKLLEAGRRQKDGAEQAAGVAPAEDKPATAPATAGKLDPTSMSVEEMLAHARGEQTGGTAAAVIPTVEPASSEEAAEPEVVEETGAEPADAPTIAGGPRNDITSVEEQLAYCRQVDAG